MIKEIQEKDIWFSMQKTVNGRIIRVAGSLGDLVAGWEENQTLIGGVLFFMYFTIQIPSYCIFCHMHKKACCFFAARCKSFCFCMNNVMSVSKEMLLKRSYIYKYMRSRSLLRKICSIAIKSSKDIDK